MNVGTREAFDLAVAWVALGVAFTVFLRREVANALFVGLAGGLPTGVLAVAGRAFALSMVTVGVGFLLHELAHKVVAIRFGQRAQFRADYGMLFLAIAGAFVGFLFAAPGAVYHRGRITARQNGLIALAGPVTNLGLAVVFAPLLTQPGFFGEVGALGVGINLLLAGFNMIPFGPLDGRSVLRWSKVVFVLTFVPSAALAVFGLLFVL
ncbi:metalloprotease [Halobacteriales archaeon QH_8_64_26]|nr:MAG: metalloprotease [Halobacteriales archaeon QH_8_64_26]